MTKFVNSEALSKAIKSSITMDELLIKSILISVEPQELCTLTINALITKAQWDAINKAMQMGGGVNL